MINKRKNQLLFILILLIVAAIIYVWWYPQQPLPISPPSTSQTSLKPANRPQVPVIGDRKVLGLSPTATPDQIKALKPSNEPSTEWEKGLKQALIKQAGKGLRDVSITQVDSLIWVQDNIALNVESVKVKIKDKNNRETEFRAMVDSSTGKVLQTWDQPIVDDFSGTEESGIKLDPRYTQD